MHHTLKYPLKKDKPDDRDYKFHELFAVSPSLKLPGFIDLRSKCPPIFDQGQLGSCTANAGVACREMMYTALPTLLSRLFMYYEERTVANAAVDSGATLRDLCKSTAKNGVCEERYMPYDITKFAVHPTADAIANALKYKISAYHRISIMQDIKNALAITQKPVLVGMEVFEGMESAEVASTGVLHMPTKSENLLGGHAVLFVGYDDVMSRLIVRNSWGKDWGLQGYFYMPYDYVNKGLAFDFWVMY